jgi:MFS transporter, PAT family, beta-lactamase induction signal transducer AmpG
MQLTTSSKLILIGSLYLSQGIPNGFFRHTTPVVFRESGLSLEQIALFYPALYAPWMLKFIWSIFVDRFHSERRGKYRSWIIPLQILTAGTMIGLANWQFGSSVSIFVLGVALINIFSSMQDVSTDGQAIQILKYGERGWGNAVQVGTFWIGYVVGGGLILMLMNSLGWSFLLVAMSIITLLATLPIVFFKKVKNLSMEENSSHKSFSGMLDFLRQPKVLLILALIGSYRMLEGFIRSILPTMFKDWGMELEGIGLTLGIVAPISALGGALIAGLWVNRLGRLRALLIFGSLQALSVLGYLFLNIESLASAEWVFPVVIIDHTISGMTTVSLFSVMMDWSRKTHGGTDYTCMDCVGVFAMMVGASASYLIAHYGGYAMSFGLALPLILISLLVVAYLYFSIESDGHWAELNLQEKVKE